jgi:hypothetical protein
MLSLPPGVELARDPSPASWVLERLRPWGKDGVRVASFVPSGFEAHARILHPAYQGPNHEAGIRWSELAERLAKSVGADTGFVEASGLQAEATPEWDRAVPSDGSLPRLQMQALVGMLETFTTTPDRCYFCIWDGWGFWWADAHSPLYPPDANREEVAASRRRAKEQDELLRRTPRFQAEGRSYFLFRGPLSAASLFEFEGWYQSPNLWWPEDEGWCVATEIDAYATYVGGSRECVDLILAASDLEAIEVGPDTRMDPGPY